MFLFCFRIIGSCRNKMFHTKSSLSPINLTCRGLAHSFCTFLAFAAVKEPSQCFQFYNMRFQWFMYDPHLCRDMYSLQRRLRIRTLQFGAARNINEIYDSVDPEVILCILIHEVHFNFQEAVIGSHYLSILWACAGRGREFWPSVLQAKASVLRFVSCYVLCMLLLRIVCQFGLILTNHTRV